MKKHCPNCDHPISNERVTKAINNNDFIHCKPCGAILKTGGTYLFTKKAWPDWLGLILLYLGFHFIKVSALLGGTAISVGAGLYLFGLYRFLKSTDLKIVAYADPDPDNVFTGGTKAEPVSYEDEVMAYKEQFKLWSPARLEEVLRIKKWSKAAKQAAKELLGE